MDKTTAFEIAELALKDALRRKCNQTFDWECQTWQDLTEACHDDVRCRRISRRNLADVVGSLRVCDLTMDSGALLVASLYRLLAIRSTLGVLMDEEGLPIDMGLRCSENGLTVRYVGDTRYDVGIAELPDSRIRRLIFRQMKRDAEHCLFGCSLDSATVRRCRHDLASELKIVCKNDDLTADDWPDLSNQIREGNGLMSGVAVQVGQWPDADAPTARHIGWHYQTTDEAYKRAVGEEQRKSAEMAADEARRAFAENAYLLLSADADRERRGGIEWMVDFPEVLNAGGAFQGFDLVAAELDSKSGRAMAADYLRRGNDSSARGKTPTEIYVEHGRRLLSRYSDSVWITDDAGLLGINVNASENPWKLKVVRRN